MVVDPADMMDVTQSGPAVAAERASGNRLANTIQTTAEASPAVQIKEV